MCSLEGGWGIAVAPVGMCQCCGCARLSLADTNAATHSRCCCFSAQHGEFARVQQASSALTEASERCGYSLALRIRFCCSQTSVFVNTDLASFGALCWYRSIWRCSCEKGNFFLILWYFYIEVSSMPSLLHFPWSVIVCLHKECTWLWVTSPFTPGMLTSASADEKSWWKVDGGPWMRRCVKVSLYGKANPV